LGLSGPDVLERPIVLSQVPRGNQKSKEKRKPIEKKGKSKQGKKVLSSGLSGKKDPLS